MMRSRHSYPFQVCNKLHKFIWGFSGKFYFHIKDLDLVWTNKRNEFISFTQECSDVSKTKHFGFSYNKYSLHQNQKDMRIKRQICIQL